MLTACSIVLAVNYNIIFAESDFNSYDSQINTENMIIAKKSFDDMSESNQEKIINASEVCLKNGKKAADIVNSFKNQTNFRIALRKMLDNYFVKDSKNSKELIEFENAIDSSADEIIENYKQAEEERNNSDNLSYETEKVILSFPYGTSKLDIDTIIKNEAVSCEIIDDGNVVIPDELPEYKKKRLEKIKDYKTDIVILADIRIEDTVSRAISKFQKYDCIKSAEHNIYFESDGTITTSSGSATTNDPDFNETKQWNMKNIDIPRAWKRYETVTGMWQIWVAVIDSGVQMNHPDLRGILLRNYSVDVTRDNKKFSTSPTTINPNGYSYGEGTSYATPHVAGTLDMMKSINYYLTPAQLLTRLQARSTITVPGTIDKTKTFKLLNAGKSVELMDNQ